MKKEEENFHLVRPGCLGSSHLICLRPQHVVKLLDVVVVVVVVVVVEALPRHGFTSWDFGCSCFGTPLALRRPI